MSWSWWPENSDGPEHEAWIQPIFVDGELGTGSSNGNGVIFDQVYEDCRLVSQRVRPFDEIVRLWMVCSCGWAGVPVEIEEMRRFGLIDERWAEPTEVGEARFLGQWHAHLAPLKAADGATCPTCGHRAASVGAATF